MKTLAERCQVCSLGARPEPPESFDRNIVVQGQDSDDDLRAVKQWIRDGAVPTKQEMRGSSADLMSYYQIFEKLELEADNLLVLRYRLNRGHRLHPNLDVFRVVMPKSSKQLLDRVFFWSHQSVTAGHFGVNTMLARACEKFYFPDMTSFITQKVKECGDCLQRIKKIKHRDCEYNPATRAGFPGELIYCDLLGPLSAMDGMKYVLTIQDSFSKFVWAYPIASKEPEVVANVIINNYVAQFGCPNEIRSDGGGEFENHVWWALCDRLQITKSKTPPESAQSNLVERFHRTLAAIIRSHLDRDDPGWMRLLPLACFAYNTRIHSSTGVSPHEALLGPFGEVSWTERY